MFCWSQTGRTLAVTGLATAADVALSNVAFLYLSVTSYTIVKSSVPMWILGFSVCLGLQQPRLSLLLVVLTIMGGLSLVAMDTPHARSNETISAPVSPSPELDFGNVSDLDASTSASFLSRNRRLCLCAAERGSGCACRRMSASEYAVGNVDYAYPGRRAEALVDNPDDDIFGLFLVVMASLCAGLRWAFSQLMLMPSTTPPRSSADASMAGLSEPAHAQERDENLAKLVGDEVASPTPTPKSQDNVTTASPASQGSGLHPFALVFGTALSGELLLVPCMYLFESSEFTTFMALQPPSDTALIVGLAAVGGALSFLLLVATMPPLLL